MEQMNETRKEVVLRACYECGSTMRGRRENYRYTECGLSSVTLVDVLVFHCKCGAIVPEIPATEELHRSITLVLLKKNTLLSGEEIRFLRKMAGYSATKLAGLMAVAKETISRWETGKTEIGKESDRLVRFACFDGIVRNSNPDCGDKTEQILEFARQVSSFRFSDFLEQIEEKMSGSEQIKINPETLSRFGSGPCDQGPLSGSTLQ